MNQKIKTKMEQLTSYQKNLIVAVAKRESDELLARVQHLADLQFCTHACKIEYLKSISFDAFFISTFESFIDTDNKQDTQPEATEPENVQQISSSETETPAETIGTEPQKKHIWTEEDVQTLLHFREKGTSIHDLAKMFEVSETAIRIKLGKLKISAKKVEQPGKNPVQQKSKVFRANGTGFISADGSLKIDDTPITAGLAKVISESGLKQFYGEIEIRIKPIQPTGITVSVEEE